MPTIDIQVKNILQSGADIVLFSAHPSLLAGSGVSGTVHKAAGPELEVFAKSLGPLAPGQSVITPAFNLPAKYIIHTVCPRYIYGTPEAKFLLAMAYKSALSLKDKAPDASSIAFVSLGTGVYRWPLEVAAKIAVTELPPFFLASIRFFTAGCIMISIAYVTKSNLKISKKEFKNICITAFFFLVYGNSVFVWALQFVDSGFGSLMASTNPLFVLIMMRIIDQKPMKKKSILGVVLGILGMILLVSQEELTTSQNSLIGVLVMLTCVLSWSYGSIFVAKAILPKNFLVSTGYQMVFGGIFLALISFVFQ